MDENVQFSKNFSNLPRVLHPLLEDSSSKPRSPIQVGDHVKVRHLGGGRWIFSSTGPHKYRLVMIDFYPSHAMKGYKWFYNHDLQLYTARTVKMMQEKDVNSIYKHVKTIELENFSRQIAARGSKHLHRGLGRTSSGGAAPTSFWNPTKSRGAIPRFLRSIVFVFFFGCWVLVSCWCFAIFRVWLSVCMDFKEGQSAERFTQSDPTPVLDMMRWGWPQGLQLHCGYLLYRLMALVIWRMKLTRPISNALFAYRRVATHQTKKMSMFAFYSLTFNGT